MARDLFPYAMYIVYGYVYTNGYMYTTLRSKVDSLQSENGFE